MPVTGGQFAVTASATSLTTALGLSAGKACRQLDVKLATGATAPAYLGAANNVTNVPANAFAQLSPGQAWSDVATEQYTVNTNNVFVVGTVNAANIIFITCVE